jgi:HlyD family secretion protein
MTNRVNVQEAKEFKVVVELAKGSIPDELWNGLRPGMTATAVITTKIKQNVVAVPLQAVIEKPAPTPAPQPGAKDQPQQQTFGERPKDVKGIYVLDNGKVKFQPVETGITGESDIEITTGIGDGVEIITGPSRVLRTLKEGATVKRQTRKPGEKGDGKGEEAK